MEKPEVTLSLIVVLGFVVSIKGALLLGQCKSSQDCPLESTCTIRGCDGSLCLCNNGSMPDGKYTKCIQIAELGEKCNDTLRCRGLSSRCNSSHCVCQNGFLQSGKYCKPQPLFSTSFALYGERCDGDRIKCPELYNLRCHKGRCICKTEFEPADAAIMDAYPFNVIQCVPKAFRIGISINASNCFYPATGSLIEGKSTIDTIDFSSVMLLPSETPNILSSQWKPTYTPLSSLSQSVLQTSSYISLDSLKNFRTSDSIMASDGLKTTIVTSLPLSPSGSGQLISLIDSSQISQFHGKTSTSNDASVVTVFTRPEGFESSSIYPSYSLSHSYVSPIGLTEYSHLNGLETSDYLTSPNPVAQRSSFVTSSQDLQSSVWSPTGQTFVTSSQNLQSSVWSLTGQTQMTYTKSKQSLSSFVIKSYTSITSTSSEIIESSPSNIYDSYVTNTLSGTLHPTEAISISKTISMNSIYHITATTVQMTEVVSSLLSERNSTDPVRSTTPEVSQIPSGTTTPFVVPVGKSCNNVLSCMEHSECQKDNCGNYRCRCKKGYVSDEGICLKLINLGESCGKDSKCIGPNTVCRHGQCRCVKGYKIATGGSRCRRIQSWFIKFPLLGDKCSVFFSECYNDYEQTCIGGFCHCKLGLRQMEQSDLMVHYSSYRQCINESIPTGFRNSDICEGEQRETETDPSVLEAKRKIAIMVGSIIGGSVAFVCLIVGIIGLICYIRHRRRTMKKDMQSDTSSEYSFDRRSSGKYSFRVPRPFITEVRDWPTDDVSFHNTAFDGDETDRLREDENKSYNGTLAKAFNFGDTDYRLHEEGK